MIKDFMNGRTVDWNDKELHLKWVRPELPEIPMWVAGYGPKALAVAGRVGDGVIIQLADPVIVQWIMDTARRAAEEAGRDPSELKCIVSAPSLHLGRHRERARAGPLVPGNGVEPRHGPHRALRLRVGSPELTEYVRVRVLRLRRALARRRSGEFVTDEICDRFTACSAPRSRRRRS